jgi:hypothetical protein
MRVRSLPCPSARFHAPSPSFRHLRPPLWASAFLYAPLPSFMRRRPPLCAFALPHAPLSSFMRHRRPSSGSALPHASSPSFMRVRLLSCASVLFHALPPSFMLIRPFSYAFAFFHAPQLSFMRFRPLSCAFAVFHKPSRIDYFIFHLNNRHAHFSFGSDLSGSGRINSGDRRYAHLANSVSCEICEGSDCQIDGFIRQSSDQNISRERSWQGNVAYLSRTVTEDEC